MANRHLRAQPSQTMAPDRSRLTDIVCLASAAVAVTLLLVPAMGSLVRLGAAAFLVALLAGLLLFHGRKGRGARAEPTSEHQQRIRHTTALQPSATIPDPPPWSVLPSIQGTFNPDDGLDSMVSPLSSPDDTGGT